MQIKSWQIALIGNIPAISFLSWPILQDMSAITVFVIFILLIVLLFPVLLLKSKNETIRRFGGVASFVYGILAAILLFKYSMFYPGILDISLKSLYALNESTVVFGIIPFFTMFGYIIASIYYFWKRA